MFVDFANFAGSFLASLACRRTRTPDVGLPRGDLRRRARRGPPLSWRRLARGDRVTFVYDVCSSMNLEAEL